MKRANVYAILTVCLALGACTRERVNASSMDPSAVVVEAARDPNVVDLDQPGKFPVVTAQRRLVTETLDANGVVAPDVDRKSVV